MSVKHHISEELLLDYASGNLAEGWSLAVATHLAMCPPCRKRLDLVEAAAGVLVDALEPVQGPADAWDQLKSRLGEAPAPSRADTRPRRSMASSELPEPLRSYVGNLADIKWRNIGAGHQCMIKIDDGETQARLLKIPAGKPVPEHSHGGRELTLVLKGSFHDEVDHFGPGDLEEADGELTHQPIAGTDEDCICLAITDAPLKFRSRLVRLVQPLFGI
ncbi:ChrR family anti-sigma-E factor [Devosia chinhatensis]|uniref:Transcriptional regulator n=1 Tax=Devosia chinhatensis TaxID=429727 RepID=A0A0F5FHR5_9HYPH|nr:ChrR family anti-sigma-E factor [Devosia chinhatensis]KKB08095.1 transcriptional regulator [Devosia chinhatensis]